MAYPISQTTAHRIMIGLISYKAQFVEKFNEEDVYSRTEMCRTLIAMLETRKFIFFRSRYFLFTCFSR